MVLYGPSLDGDGENGVWHLLRFGNSVELHLRNLPEYVEEVDEWFQLSPQDRTSVVNRLIKKANYDHGAGLELFDESVCLF